VRDGVNRQIEELVRQEWPRLVATLVGQLGDLTLAEDAAQDAAEAALRSWLDDGVPDRPGAWITTVARRRAVDRIRREKRGREKIDLLTRMADRAPADGDDPEAAVLARPGASVGRRGSSLVDEPALRDDQLGLIFGCCHPALSVEAQIALTLRSVGGLTTAEIGRGFLVPEATMAQRLVRAKRKIAAAAIPFRIPDDAELLSRLGAVHHVLYLVFTEGHASARGPDHLRPDLTAEAIRLSRLLASLLNDDAETVGQLALFLFIEARREARLDERGDVVLLDDQDRTRWDGELIAEADRALQRALALGRPGPYQVEAAINALHAEAPTAAETDWPQIEALYRELVRHRPTPVTTLNLAVAAALARGPEVGLELLDEPALADRLDTYPYYHAARADLLRRLGRSEAAVAYRRAIEVTANEAEQRFLRRRLAELGRADDHQEDDR
jgi:RNA polymerase sigma-70 factor (ECF subfamily)